MKKVYLRAFAASAILLAAASCSKETQTPLEPGKATITGKVWCNTNETNDTMMAPINTKELAPAGTMITFVIKGEDLDPNPQMGYPYKDIIKTATVGADGTFSVEVPAYEKAIDVKVKYDDFATNATVWDMSVTPQRTMAIRKVYMKGDEMVSVVAGMKKVMADIEYMP